MHVIKPVMLLCVGITLLSAGCMSVRTTTDFKPESDPALTSPAGQFRIVGLKYSEANLPADSPYIENVIRTYERRLIPLVQSECVARYPQLFVQDSADALPIWIEVSEECEQHNGKIMAWMFGTLTVVPLILPAPMFQIDRDITVAVGLWDGRVGMVGGAARKCFRREEHGWGTILTPLGLITIPGKADFPKVSEAGNMGRFGYNDVPQVAQQVATAAAKLVASQDPAYWTTQPRGPIVPYDTDAIPTALPAPSESGLPF